MPFKTVPPLYSVWRSMLRRCYSPSYKAWPDYGGRGISVCQRWRDAFANFVEDMGPRPPGHSLDRVDNDGNYEPGNCRWATRKEQQSNQRRTVRVVVDGKTYKAIDLAAQSGHKADTIVRRARKGYSLAAVLSPEVNRDLSGLALGGEASGARKRAATHCKNGHEFTPENTRITPEGWRTCRACHAAKMRERSRISRGA